mmetsp:Transcript_66275/g.209527  ORF Transcript_66275/g.209527 Transcript_66275/m.209527 type:complete len:411 (-) Transcript_66275:478-1710(-)
MARPRHLRECPALAAGLAAGGGGRAQEAAGGGVAFVIIVDPPETGVGGAVTGRPEHPARVEDRLAIVLVRALVVECALGGRCDLAAVVIPALVYPALIDDLAKELPIVALLALASLRVVNAVAEGARALRVVHGSHGLARGECKTAFGAVASLRGARLAAPLLLAPAVLALLELVLAKVIRSADARARVVHDGLAGGAVAAGRCAHLLVGVAAHAAEHIVVNTARARTLAGLFVPAVEPAHGNDNIAIASPRAAFTRGGARVLVRGAALVAALTMGAFAFALVRAPAGFADLLAERRPRLVLGLPAEPDAPVCAAQGLLGVVAVPGSGSFILVRLIGGLEELPCGVAEIPRVPAGDAAGAVRSFERPRRQQPPALPGVGVAGAGRHIVGDDGLIRLPDAPGVGAVVGGVL